MCFLKKLECEVGKTLQEMKNCKIYGKDNLPAE